MVRDRAGGDTPDSLDDDQLRRSPLVVFFEFTRACDLACRHCRPYPQQSLLATELSTVDVRRLIQQVLRFPLRPTLFLTGGDPLKRNDVYDVVEYAAWSELEVAVTLAPTENVTGAAMRRLRDAGAKRFVVGVDGPNEKTHDAVRRVAASFESALHILATAGALGVPTQVNTVVTRSNYRAIEAIGELLSRYRTEVWELRFPAASPDGHDELQLNAEQYEHAFELIWRQAKRVRYLVKTLEAPHYRRFVMERQRRRASTQQPWRARRFTPQHAPLGLNAGKGMMYVRSSGVVCPAAQMQLVCGLFPLDDLVHIYQHSALLSGLRDAERLQGKCRLCEYRRMCGGSRARAYAATDNPFAEDPGCAFVPAKMRRPK